jgi:hypothetical protein
VRRRPGFQRLQAAQAVCNIGEYESGKTLEIELFSACKRRGRDSNPRDASRRPTVFKTAAFVRSATPPWLARARLWTPALTAG